MHLLWELQTQLQQAFVAAGSQPLLWPNREGGLEYRQQSCARWSEYHSAVPAKNDPAVVLLLLTDQSVSVSDGKHV